MDKKLKMEVYLPQKFKKLQNILVTFFLDFLWFENLWRSEISNLFLGKWSLTRLSSYTELYLSMTNTQKIRRSVRLKKQTSHFWPGNVVKVFVQFWLELLHFFLAFFHGLVKRFHSFIKWQRESKIKSGFFFH